MDDSCENIKGYNLNKERKVLIISDYMISDIQ